MDRSVLLVEDNEQAAKLFALYLLREGYRVVRVATGEEALGAAVELAPVAIVLDVILPGMDGWDVLTALKASPLTRAIPVVIVSVLDRQTLAFRLGAFDHLVKPVDRAQLVRVVERSLTGTLGERGLTVLVLHEPDDAAAALEAWFARSGYRFYAATARAEALLLARQLRPDLMVFELPDGECLQTVAELRAQPETRETPVLLVTSARLPPEQQAVLSGRTEMVVLERENEEEMLVSIVANYLAQHARLPAP